MMDAAAAAATQEGDQGPKKTAIVGSWLETVTFSGEGAPPPLKSLVTFIADGVLVVADQGNVTTETVFSAGHGAWVHLRGRKFA